MRTTTAAAITPPSQTMLARLAPMDGQRPTRRCLPSCPSTAVAMRSTLTPARLNRLSCPAPSAARADARRTFERGPPNGPAQLAGTPGLRHKPPESAGRLGNGSARPDRQAPRSRAAARLRPQLEARRLDV